MPAPRKPAVVFIFITLVLDVIGFGLIVPILPKLITEFHGGSAPNAALTYGLLLTLYARFFVPMSSGLRSKYVLPLLVFSPAILRGVVVVDGSRVGRGGATSKEAAVEGN